MDTPKRITLFGGQGTPIAALASTTREDSTASSNTAILLSRCHVAFLSELQTLEPDSQVISRDASNLFSTPKDIVNPPSKFHNNPVIQSTTLCLHQLLRYLTVTENESCIENSFHRIHELAGQCSGLLPASVVAASSTLESFLNYAVEAFRLSFWIGYRSAMCYNNGAAQLPRSMVIIGATFEQLSKSLEEFHLQAKQKDVVHIGVISSERCISVTGESVQLELFRQHCASLISSVRYPDVHGMFHGGSQLTFVMNQILEDLASRDIRFPSFSDLQLPLRSTWEAEYLSTKAEGGSTLAAEVIKLMMVHPVNWHLLSSRISITISEQLIVDPSTSIEIQSLGPHSKSLFLDIKKDHFESSRVVFSDLSGRPNPEGDPARVQSGYAIVGMGLNFPNGNGVNEFWETLRQGISASEEVPSSRFQISDFHTTQSTSRPRRQMSTRHGNFLDDISKFDPAFFNISPREAKSMDPQQRLLLQTTLAALENAGYAEDSTPTFDRSTFGCYVGAATGDYVDNLRNDIDVYYSTGTLRAFMSGRLSYAFKMSGPSMVIDTACSSSAVAIHQACRALENGDCKAAIAGGVNTISSPDMYLGLSRAHFLSPTGSCKPFDEAADGYSRAEGCGIFILKRLSDAISENDRIHAIIRGTEVNQCGNSYSITHPDSSTQASLFTRTLENCGETPNSVDVVEAHGTGTQAGDFAEISSLSEVFGHDRGSDNPLLLSSVKGNIGHAEAASGAAALAKIVLMLHYKEIPAQANHTVLNPRLSVQMANSNILVPRKNQEWREHPSRPRRALLNNFGAAGSNTAILVDEYVKPRSSHISDDRRSTFPFNVSARSPGSLEKVLQEYRQLLATSGNNLKIQDICYCACARRQSYEYRLSIKCSSIEDLAGKLREIGPGQPVSFKKACSIIFVFSGQGASYLGMGKELLLTSPTFRKTVDACDRILKTFGISSLFPILLDEVSTSVSDSVEVGLQCACFVVEYALAKLLMFWGILPNIVAGHSLGEYAALAIAGVASLEDILGFVATRAKLMLSKCLKNSTGMIACAFNDAVARDMFCQLNTTKLVVACRNSSRSCVVAGPLGDLKILQAHCAGLEYNTKVLQVPYGFHSPAMDPILPDLEDAAKKITLHQPLIPLISSVLGRSIELGDLGASYFTQQTRHPVNFTDVIDCLNRTQGLESGVFFEIGPHPITLPMIEETLSTAVSYIPTLRKNLSAWTSLSETLGKSFLFLNKIKWREIFENETVKLIDLPGHPLEKSEYFVHYDERKSAADTLKDELKHMPVDYSLLTSALPSAPNSTSQLYETNMEVLGQFVRGHDVGGTPICPASVFHEIVLEAAQSWTPVPQGYVFTLTNVDFPSALIAGLGDDGRTIRIILSRSSTDQLEFQVVSLVAEDSNHMLHCRGSVKLEKVQDISSQWIRQSAQANRISECLFKPQGLVPPELSIFRKGILYQQVFSRVVAYSSKYQTLTYLNVSSSGQDGYGRFRLPLESHLHSIVTSPYFTDTLLHSAGFIANISVPSTQICICGKVDSTRLLYDEIDWKGEFTVQCSLFNTSDESVIMADAFAFDSIGKMVAAVEGIHFKKMRLSSFQSHLQRHRANGAKVFEQQRVPPEIAPFASSNLAPISDFKSKSPPITQLKEDELKAEVFGIIAKTCSLPASSMDEGQHLAAIGVDSLMMLELHAALSHEFSMMSVGAEVLHEAQTLGDVAEIYWFNYSSARTSDTVPTPPELYHSPNASGSSGYSTPSSTPPRQNGNGRNKIMFALQTVCGVNEAAITPDRTLDSIGLDSLMTIELENILRDDHGFKCDMSGIYKMRTVADLLELGQEDVQPPPKRREIPRGPDHKAMLSMDSLPVRLQSSETAKFPLFLFHDGSGLCHVYTRLQSLERKVFGLFNPAFFEAEKSPKTLAEMASRFTTLILDSNLPNVILAGWSFGGVLAFEVALQLRRAGIAVSGVILIDSPFPVSHEPLPQAVINHITLSPPRFGVAQTLQQRVIEQFNANAGLLAKYHPSIENSIQFPMVMLRSRDGFEVSKLCGVEYPWLSHDKTKNQSIEDWNDLIGRKLVVMDIPGNHFEAFATENIPQISAQLRVACEMIEKYP